MESSLTNRLKAALGNALLGAPWRTIATWSLYGAAVFVAIACASFEPDPESPRSAVNLAGSLGTYIARGLVESVGIGSFVLCFFLVLLGFAIHRSRGLTQPLIRVFGAVGSMYLLGLVCNLLGPRLLFPGGAAPIGGLLGYSSAIRLASVFGLWGSAMLAAITLGLSLLLMVGRDLWPFTAVEETETTESLRRVRERRAAAEGLALPPATELDALGTATVTAPTPMIRDEEEGEDVDDDFVGHHHEPDDEEAEIAEEDESAPTAAELRAEAAREKRAAAKKARAAEALAEKKALAEERARELAEALAASSEDEEEEDDESESALESSGEDDAWEEGEDEWEEDDEASEDEESEGDEEAEGEEEYEDEEEAEETLAPAARQEDTADDAADESAADDVEVFEDDALPKSKPPIRAPAGTGGETFEVILLERDPAIRGREKYPLPPLTLLDDVPKSTQRESDAVIHRKAADLEEALKDFNINAEVQGIERGPVITRYDLTLSRGTKISKVTGLADDLALTLGVSRVRIAPVKGKSALGVEIPNRYREGVSLRDVATSIDMRSRRIAIPLYLGMDAAGRPMVEDLAATPHLLIAGRTGAGKSVFINCLVLSILLTRYPEEVRLIMIDPKKVELEVYQDIPHLLTKVESNPKRATKILEWAVDQMEERYEYLAACGVRHLTSYNKLAKAERVRRLSKTYSDGEIEKIPQYLPYVVIIVDELADLMMVSGKDVEHAIARLSQKARAVGIHVVLATQRPSIDVITGLIKSNLPARIAFQTRTGIDSRTILDRYGAEKLLDKGDMLYLSASSDDPKRMQGPFVSDEEVEKTVDYLREFASPFYTQRLEQVGGSATEAFAMLAKDEMFEQAVDTVLTTGQASASFLQRRLQVGYARASRLIDLMGEAGLVSEHRGSKAREILMTPEEWEEMRQKLAKTASA